ncbi:MAG: type III-B CRISPR-associated protein Cas10/Cmr2 [candidate division WOR-3 bacterium]
MVQDNYSVDYVLKLKALMHDPIYKISTLGSGHENIAKELYKLLMNEEYSEDGNLKKADHISSAISRIVVKDAPWVDFEESYFIDPFTLKKTEPIKAPEKEEDVKDIFKELGNKLQCKNNPKLCFLFLWRFLPDIFPWIKKHPADSRAPNHSIYDHLVQSSCIATCLDKGNKPAFLLFTISPVQSFVAIARKTSDLWAGSYLISYLIYKAIEVIMDELGPDHIIFPNLRGQPLVDLWLYEKHFKNLNIDKIGDFDFEKRKHKDNLINDKLLIANFPNRFLAIVPYGRAKDIAKECQEAIGKAIDELLEKVESLNDDKVKEEVKKVKYVIKEHLTKYLKIYWVVLPFYENNYTDVEPILKDYKNLIVESDLYKVVKTIVYNPYYKNLGPNVGSAYSLLVELTERFLASRKAIRDFEVVKIDKESIKQCHLCGEYEVLDIKWENIGRKYVGESERLCGMCFFKRLLPKLIENKFGLELKFPSTAEMATVKYKEDLYIDLRKIEKFLDNYNLPKTASVPKLKNKPLYDIDGQWLMESSYRKEYLKREYGINVPEEELEEMRKFLNEKKIKPPTYYAILSVDGDNMGKWLKGEYLPTVEKLLHEKVRNEPKLTEDQNIKRLLESIHPMSPSFHNLFSRRLSEFALERVSKRVEKVYYGKLIYAGGDDVLAFLPVDEALNCACDLNKAFKILLGEKASVSAGIVFVHHKYPLSLALREVRDAQKRAKRDYGRSAVCIKQISGSGQVRTTGFKWEDKDFFDKIVEKYSREELSSKFAYDLVDVVRMLQGKENKVKDETLSILEREIKRLYRRKVSKDNVDKDFEEKLLNTMKRYKDNILAFADMLIIARFVAKMGAEG